jgi:hypothetical protein
MLPLLLATGRKAHKAKGKGKRQRKSAPLLPLLLPLLADAKSKGCLSCLCKATLCFWLCNAKAKGAKVVRLRVILLLLRRNITFAFGYSSWPNRPGASRAYSPASSKRPASRRQKEQRLRLLPLPFAFASIAKSKGSVVKSKGATVKSKGRHKLRCLLPSGLYCAAGCWLLAGLCIAPPAACRLQLHTVAKSKG